MKRIVFILFILFSFLSDSTAQSFFPHYSLKKVSTGRESHLRITSDADLNYIKLNTPLFTHVNSVCIDGNIDINKALSVLYHLDEIYELKLRKYTGKIRLMGSDSLALFEEVIYYITYKNEEDLATIDKFPKIKSLAIIHPGPVIEDFYLMKGIKRTKNVSILGDFLPNDMDSITHYLSKMKQLREIGIGLDYVTDLKKSLLTLPYIKTISVYDNASHVNNIEYVDYPMDKRYITFKKGNTKKQVELRFYSDREQIEPFDLYYIQGQIPKAKFNKNTNIAEKTKEVIFNNWSILAEDTIPKIDYASHAHPATQIPISYLAPTVEYYPIDPSVNNIIFTKNGTELKILANSITHPNGATVKDQVVISFADLGDPVNTFLTGIALEARRKGRDIQLNPLTMFEVKAFANGKPVKIKTDKALKATFILPRDTAFSSYVLDPLNRKWRPMSGYYYTSQLGKVKNASFSNWKSLESTKELYSFDNTPFNNRYTTPEYFFLMQQDYKKRNFEKRSGMRFNSYSTHYFYSEDKSSIGVKKGKKLVKIVKIPRLETDPKTLIRFQLIDNFEFKLFPELRAFRKYQFKLKYGKGRREFSKTYTSKKRYFDIRIIYTKNSSTGKVELKEENGYKLLSFQVPTEEKEQFNKLYAKYMQVLKLRENEFNSVLSAKENKFITNYHSARKKEGMKEYSSVLKDFGIYTFSNEAKIDAKKEIIANFTDENGIPLDLKKCYILHKNSSTVYTFTDGNIYFDKNQISAIICTDHKGFVYYIDGESVIGYQLEDYSYSVIKLEKIDAPLKTAESFKRHIGVR